MAPRSRPWGLYTYPRFPRACPSKGDYVKFYAVKDFWQVAAHCCIFYFRSLSSASPHVTMGLVVLVLEAPAVSPSENAHLRQVNPESPVEL